MKQVQIDATKSELDMIEKLKRVPSVIKHPEISDMSPAVYLRFLRFSNGNFQKAKSMVEEHVSFRMKYDRVLRGAVDDSWTPSPLLRTFLPYVHRGNGFLGRDKEGYPITVVRAGKVDPVGLSSVCTSEDCLQAAIFAQERMMRKDLPAFGDGKKHQVTMIMDLKGVGMHFMTPSAISTVSAYMSMSVKNYPEEFRRVFMIRAPSAFPMIFSAVKGLIPEKDRKIVRVLGSDYLDILRTYIDDDQIPSYLGGSLDSKISQDRIVPGGRVPVSKILCDPENVRVQVAHKLCEEDQVSPVSLLSWSVVRSEWGISTSWQVQYCAQGYLTRWHSLPISSTTLLRRDSDGTEHHQIELALRVLRPGASMYGIRIRCKCDSTSSTGSWHNVPYFRVPKRFEDVDIDETPVSPAQTYRRTMEIKAMKLVENFDVTV
eukprot:g26.t1